MPHCAKPHSVSILFGKTISRQDAKIAEGYYSGCRCQALVNAPFRQVDGAYNLIVFELFAKSAWHLSNNDARNMRAIRDWFQRLDAKVSGGWSWEQYTPFERHEVIEGIDRLMTTSE